MPELVSSDQTDSINSRMAADDVRRLLHITDAATDSEMPMSLLSVDAMKVFDRLEWSVLAVMGFGPTFIGILKVPILKPLSTGVNRSNYLLFTSSL